MEREVDQFEPDLLDVLADWMTWPGPLYQSLADALDRAVREGDLDLGARLPSERDLARQLAISRGTVVSAYDELRGRGVLTSVRGSGTRISEKVRAGQSTSDGRVPGGHGGPVFQRLVDGSGEVISLANTDDAAYHEVRDALLELVDSDLLTLMTDSGYHPSGLPELRTAIATGYTAMGAPSSAEQVLITTGAHQAISLIAKMYLRRGCMVLTESPAWPGCLDLFRAAGARIVGIPLDGDGVRADLLAAAMAQHRPALVFLMPTYHNPTGLLMSSSRRRRIAALAEEYGVPVVEDNAHLVLGSPGPQPIAASPGGAVLSVGSLAKAVWPGLRIGWVRAAEPTIRRLARHKALADLGSPVLDQALAARLLPGLPALAARRAPLREERLRHLESLLRRYLPDWQWRRPQGGSVLWIELPSIDAARYAQVALRHGVEVIPGAATDPEGHHDSYLRLPFSYPPSTLDELVHRLRRAWVDMGSDNHRQTRTNP
ncbi:MAG: PLP-dependent aminotransferase family protein [Geodermatophilaceae bacterium]|nr:PLP-dependent aminotransferase family protein [Geodermatophilaceae bacterium]